MIASVPLEGILVMVVALVLAGALTGFVAGLLGVGGGGILVPVLYETFTFMGVDPAIRMHLALGTSLAVILPTSLRSFAAHRVKGSVDMALLKRIAPWLVAGVVFGTVIASSVDSRILKAIWVVFGGALAIKMAFGRENWRLGDDLPKAPWVEVFSFLVGVVSVLMSIAGAVFVVTYLTLYNRPLLPSVSTASGLGPLVAIPGMIGFIIGGWGEPTLPPTSLGYVNLLGAAVIIPASVLMAPVGAKLAHGVSKRTLEKIFAVFLALVAIRFAVSLMGG